MYFLIEDDDLLEKYNAIWDKVSADIKEGFDSELVYNKNYLKNKIKSHGVEVTDFFNKEIPKLESNLAVIRLDSLKKNDNYYPQVFLNEFKYIEKKVIGHKFFEGATLKSLMKNNFLFNTYRLYNFLSFFNKSLLTFVFDAYSEKEYLKIRKVNRKIDGFI